LPGRIVAGISVIAIQELIKQFKNQKNSISEIELLKKENEELRSLIKAQEERISRLENN